MFLLSLFYVGILFQIVRILLEHSANINISDIRGATPLHRAASKGNLDVVKLLLKFKGNLSLEINVKDVYGNTPLHLACEEDRREEAKLLVENGASLEVKNRETKTPLDVCSHGLFRILNGSTLQ